MVRETLSVDLIDRLISDICEVTETLMQSDKFDLAAWQPGTSSVEKKHRQEQKKEKESVKAPMHEGIHRSVC